jgi:hypothetical protein
MDEEVTVRCQCGYVMRRRPALRDHGETWLCYTWHHRSAPEKLNYCPICGAAPSLLSTAVIAAGGAQRSLRQDERSDKMST